MTTIQHTSQKCKSIFRKNYKKGGLPYARKKAWNDGPDRRLCGGRAVAVCGGSVPAAAAAVHWSGGSGDGKKAGIHAGVPDEASPGACRFFVRAGNLRAGGDGAFSFVPAFMPGGRRVFTSAAGAGRAAGRARKGLAGQTLRHRGQISGRRGLRPSRGTYELF